MPQHASDEMRECIDRCQTCQETCLDVISHCLEKRGEHTDAEHIRMLMVCAEICGTSARFMLLGSPYHTRTCEVCAEICEACAEDCDRFDDDMMKRCADVCRRCAEACREMAATRLRA